MIPCLYSPLTTDFSTFGIGHLSDAVSPHVYEERNGEFTLEFQYPVDGEHYREIETRCIVTAKPSPAQDPQPFRIFRISKPINGVVTVNARHVRYDLEGVPVMPFTANGIADALAKLKSYAVVTNNFTFTTNKTNTQIMTLKAPASTLSLLGGVQGSLLDVYGGEYKYDVWNVALLSQRGTDSGVTIRYGVDLTDFQQEENCANVYTAVLCYWKSQDDEIVIGQQQSSGVFDYERVLVVDRSQNYELAPTVAQLNQDAVNYINSNKVGVPKVSINLSFVNLEQTEEFRNIRQSVELCDQITVEFPKHGVSAYAKVITTDYDVINERYISVGIGDSRTTLADTFVAVETKAESAPTSEQMQQAINATTTAITGANGGSVRLLDTNSDNLPDTLYIADNPSPLLASKVWRFNYEGWGASQNGYNGPFTLGATFAQGIIADFITAGTLNASLVNVTNINASNITAGTLSANRIAANSIAVSKLTGTISNSGWELNLTDGTFKIGTLSANNITSGTIDASDITVTNLNASNITTGTINGQRIADSSITGAKIQSKAITGSKIDDNTITGSKVDTGTLTSRTIASGAVTTSKIDSSAVTEAKIKDSAVTEGKIGDSAVTTGKIESLAVTTGKIAGSAVTRGKTNFTGTLDQVDTNTSNISSINNYFSGTSAATHMKIANLELLMNGNYTSIGGKVIQDYDGNYVAVLTF